MNIKKEISEYIYKFANIKSIEVTEETDLFDIGLLDSLGIIMLLTYLNESLNINISLEDLKIENFKTISSIIDLVEKLN